MNMDAGKAPKYQRAAQIGAGVKFHGAKKSQKTEGKVTGHNVKSLEGSIKERAIQNVFGSRISTGIMDNPSSRQIADDFPAGRVSKATLVGVKKIKGLKRAFKIFGAKIFGKKAKLTKLKMQDAQGKQFSVKIDKKTAKDIKKQETRIKGTLEARGRYIKGELEGIFEKHFDVLEWVEQELKGELNDAELSGLKGTIDSTKLELESEFTKKWGELTSEPDLKREELDILRKFRDEAYSEAKTLLDELKTDIHNKMHYS